MPRDEWVPTSLFRRYWGLNSGCCGHHYDAWGQMGADLPLPQILGLKLRKLWCTPGNCRLLTCLSSRYWGLYSGGSGGCGAQLGMGGDLPFSQVLGLHLRGDFSSQ